MSHAPARGVPQRAGFTLLELLAVLLVVATLSGIVLGVGRRAVESARRSRAQAELAALSAALEAYRRDFGDYPRTDDPAVLRQSLLGARDPLGREIQARPLIEAGLFTHSDAPEISAALLDPWGEPYRYACRTNPGWAVSGFVLFSSGPDRRWSGQLLAGIASVQPSVEDEDNLHAMR